jgi:DMSO/TMAO reductase YedYZ molybdopterin-dependent catalytic subunit
MTRDRETPPEREQRLIDEQTTGRTLDADAYKRRSRRSFLGFGAAALVGFGGFKYVQGRPENQNIPDVIRWGLERNRDVWSTISATGDAPTFGVGDREDLRVNGLLGMRRGNTREFLDVETENWQIRVIGVGGANLGTVTIPEIKALPVQEVTWEHKCIEGWSNIVGWTGTRFSDFAAAYPDDWGYVSFRTPDERYYVGWDRDTVLHDQTLMAWQLNGEPLSQRHGAPLRIATPLKYGIKQLKRIGIIEFTNDQPGDYWGERGYDWHAGL